VLWAAVIGAWNVRLGFGIWADFLFAFAVAAIGIPLVALLVALLLTILRRLPRLLSGFVVGSLLFIALVWFRSFGLWVGAVLLIVECSLGAAIATMALGGLHNTGLAKRIVTISVGILALGSNIALWHFLTSDGVDEELIRITNTGALPARLDAPDPAQRGVYRVKTLYYGAGNDLRRPEYGRSVAIRTTPLDASPFLKEFDGWKAYVRRLYWGFGMNRLPLNGRVWYPDGPGPFPLVLMVHGNHVMSEFSDAGYAYLGELLSSRGFIFASVDENFLNSGLFHDPSKQQVVRGWMLLEHLKLWRNWNVTPGNPFYRRVDVDNVALMGHSRGGEAAATAALLNELEFYPDDATIRFHYGFPIKSIVAIAPVDGQYKPAGQWRVLEDVNYFTIHGANDADVSSFMGSRQWDHTHFTGKGDYFKSELYIYRANHGQFNTVWGRTDTGAPQNWFLNLRPLLAGEDQRRIAKIYISAFLEATLHNRREYVPLFEDYRRARDWLPATLYVSRYLDASNKVVSDFSEDADVTTTTVSGGHIGGQNLTVWREARIPFRNGDRDYNGVFVGWNREHPKNGSAPPVASYTIDLPPGLAGNWQLGAQSALTLSIAVSDENAPLPGKKENEEEVEDGDKPEPTDFTIALESQEGVITRLPLSKFGTLLPPVRVQLTKLERMDKILYKNASEPVFQSFAIPLAAFASEDRRFDPARLKTVRLEFDRTPSRVLAISEVGFSILHR
jgi:hypothetical protein